MNVMSKVEYLAKDDTISYKSKTGGTTNYKGLSEEKVTKAIREQLVEQNIIVYPIKQEHHREGQLTTVDVTYRFVCVDDGSWIEAVSSGTGVDTQDKGVGKAMTYAYKYLWLRTFAIPTGEDPDKISSAELDDKQKADRVNNAKKIIFELLEDNLLDSDFVTHMRLDLDQAVSDGDIDKLEMIRKQINASARKSTAEQNADNDEAVKKAMKYNEEPPLPDSKPSKEELELF